MDFIMCNVSVYRNGRLYSVSVQMSTQYGLTDTV